MAAPKGLEGITDWEGTLVRIEGTPDGGSVVERWDPALSAWVPGPILKDWAMGGPGLSDSDLESRGFAPDGTPLSAPAPR